MENIVHQAIAMTELNGGATVSLNGEETPRAGFGVAMAAMGKRIASGEWREEIDAYVGGNEMLSTPGVFLGLWVDTEKNDLWVDTTRVVENLDDALAIAREANEIAVWDFANMAEIRA